MHLLTGGSRALKSVSILILYHLTHHWLPSAFSVAKDYHAASRPSS